MALKIKLIAHTMEPEKVVASAAKLCYSPVGVDEIQENLTDEGQERFLEMLVDLGHLSTVEHVSFTFAVEGVSRVLTHQLVRHRLASYSQQSQRYVKLEQFEYIVPPAIEKNEIAKAIFVEQMENAQKAYDALVEQLQGKYFDEYVSEGNSEKKARGMAEKKAIEDARFVFPNACETKIVLTMNARTLMHFFEHRACNRAQWEIQDMAIEMIKIVKGVAPTLFKHAGPACVHGPCPEGKMTCGKINEVRAFFTELGA